MESSTKTDIEKNIVEMETFIGDQEDKAASGKTSSFPYDFYQKLNSLKLLKIPSNISDDVVKRLVGLQRKVDNLHNFFKMVIDALNKYSECLPFCWIIYSNNVDRLKAMADIFIKRPIQETQEIIFPPMKDTIISTFQVMNMYTNEKPANDPKADSNRMKFFKSFILPTFDVHVKSFTEEENSELFSDLSHQNLDILKKFSNSFASMKAKFIDPQNVNKIIQELVFHQELQLEILEEYAEFIKSEDIKEIFNNKDSANTTGLKHLLAFRKLCRVHYRDNPENIDEIKNIIMSLDDPTLQAILIFAYSFDTKQTSYIREFSNNDNNMLLMHLQHSVVAFSPLFLSINTNELKSLALSSIRRKKRNKGTGNKSDLIGFSYFIVKSPILFSHLILDNNDTNIFNQEMRIHRSEKSEWTIGQAKRYIDSILQILNHDSHIIVIKIISKIQKLLISHLQGIDHDFLIHNFLNDYLQDSESYDYNLNLAFQIIDSSSFYYLSDEQKHKYIDLIFKKTQSKDNNFFNEAIKQAKYCLTKEPYLSSKLIPPILDSLTEHFTSEDIPTLVTIYCIIFHQENSDEKTLERVIGILREYLRRNQRDYIMLNAIISILFEELYSDHEFVSNRLIILISDFFRKDESNLKPSNEMKIVSMFPNYFGIICEKFHTSNDYVESKTYFFDLLIYDFIVPLITNKTCENNLFEFLMDTIVDTFLQYPNGGDSFFKFINSTKDKIVNDKKHIFDCTINEFLCYYNHPLEEIDPEQHNNCYIITKNTLQALKYQQNDFIISTKTRTGSSKYEIECFVPTFDNEPIHNNDNSLEPVDIVEDEFNQTFTNCVKECVTDEQANQIINNYFDFLNDSSQTKIEHINVPRSNVLPNKSDTPQQIEEINNLLYDSLSATAFYYSVFPIKHQDVMKNSDDTIIFKPPSSLTNISTSKLFQLQIRETLKIGFLYVQNEQISQNDILKNDWSITSDQFRSFVKSIGEIIDLSTHTNFDGKLDSTNFSNGRYHLYYSDRRIEVLYHVAPLIPTDPKDEQQIYKKRHIGNDNIHIVWTENKIEYDPTTISSQFNDAHLIIYPLNTEFYRVQIRKKDKNYLFGPLQGETIVSKKALPELIRWTSIFSDRAARKHSIATNMEKLPSQMFAESLMEIRNSKSKEEK